MAKKENNLLFKNELMWEEQQKKKKKAFYKNWKTYAIGLGIIVIGTGVGLGIYYGVSANQGQGITPPALGLTDEDIVIGINGATYEATATAGDDISIINNQITSEFIKKQLTGEVKESFNLDSFHFNKVTINGKDLITDDLTNARTFSAQINYNYGAIENKETNLTINVLSAPISDQDIVAAINDVTNYEKEVKVHSKASDIKIDVAFIKKELSEEIKSVFNDEVFQFEKITIDGKDLKDHHLTQTGTIDVKINYNYDKISNQEASLKLKITGVDDSEITKAINNETYEAAAPSGSTINAIIDQITLEFIKKPLNDEIKNAFNDALFQFNEVTVDGHKLKNEDLVREKRIEAKINYSYGIVKDTETSLIINITTGDREIADAINASDQYTMEVEAGTIVKKVEDQITPEFIKKQLSSKFEQLFNDELFNLNQLNKMSGDELKDEDLSKPVNTSIVVNYNYGSIKEQETTLTVTVTKPINNNDIVAAINSITYTTKIEAGDKAAEVEARITPEFIQEQLKTEIKNAFNPKLFNFNEIIFQGHRLKDSDLPQAGWGITTNIIYNYDYIENQKTTLQISIN